MMKRNILFFVLTLSIFVVNAKDNEEFILGMYWNSYSNKSLQVSAIVDGDNELTLFLEIPVYHRGVQEMKLEIKEKDIPKLRETLLEVKRQRNLYIETMKDYGVNQMKEKLDIKYPSMRLWWKVGDYWEISQWEKFKPVFLAEKGIYYVYIEEQVHTSTLKDDLITAGVVVAMELIFGSNGGVVPVSKPEYMTFKWGFSTQKDIMTIVDWLDVDLLKKKYKAKKN